MLKNFISIRIIQEKREDFSYLDTGWLKNKSIKFAKKNLYNKNFKIYDLLNYKEVHILFIWFLINFKEWLKQFKLVSE